jgi:hypothetical protein
MMAVAPVTQLLERPVHPGWQYIAYLLTNDGSAELRTQEVLGLREWNFGEGIAIDKIPWRFES